MATAANAEHSGYVFICHAEEDSGQVAALERIFAANGILVWRSESSLRPGDERETRIRNAIEHQSIVFLACFSTRSTARRTSYQNAELLIAIDELRSRRPDGSWLIPVRLDDCQIPELLIGGGRTLASIQRTDLFGSRMARNRERLVARIREICAADSGQTEDPAAEPEPSATPKPGWVTAIDVVDRTYQEWIGWAGTMISPFAMSAVLRLGTDPGVAAVYLARVPLRKAARMLAASPPQVAGDVLKQMNADRATAILKNIPADIAQAIAATM